MKAMAEAGLKNRQLDIQEGQGIQEALARQAELEAQANKPGPIENINVSGGVMQMVRNPQTGIFEPIKVEGSPQTLSTGLNNLPDALKPFAKDFERAGAKYGVAPNILAAISMHETGNGTSSAFRNKNNAMGISNASGPVEVGSVAESIDKMARLLGKGINERTGPYANVKSIEDIAKVYAPVGAGNDPKNLKKFWSQGVAKNIEMLSKSPTESSVGFKPDETETYRPFTEEEKARYGSDGQVSSSGKVFPIRPASGTEFITNPDGSVTYRQGAGVGGSGAGPKVGEGQTVVKDATSPTGTRVVNIPGGKAELEAQQAINAKEAAKERGVELGTVALSEIDRFIEYTNRMSNLPGASALRPAMAKFGMQEQAEAQSSLDTVSANLKFEALDALRQSSPSGASGLGQVTQNEFSALADQWGTLRLQGDPEKIRERAISIKRKLLDIVHGSAKHREELLKKGVITSDQYNKIQSQYPGEQQATQEDANLQRYRDIFNTQQ
jgi:hypothetical protein